MIFRQLQVLWISFSAVSLLLSVKLSLGQRIWVNKSCYTFGQAIQISFDNSDHAHADNWIAVYRADDIDASDLGSTSSLMWVWTCGTQTCFSTRDSGTVQFRPDRRSDEWPLDAGEYQVALSGGEEPYKAFALSDVFTVTEKGESCGQDNHDDYATSSGGHGLVGMARVIKSARADIAALIDADPFLSPAFLRLAFHDCVGGCDGCVDVTDPSNAGLDSGIDTLKPIVATYGEQGLSRTDIWVLAALVGVEVTAAGHMDFPMQWIGRQTCDELNNGDCGSSTTCTQDRGPKRELCHGEAGTTKTLEFFDKVFGFNAQQTAAIMGGHSIGQMQRTNSGFDGENGWDDNNLKLDNGYYTELVGDDDPVDDAPDWEREFVDNSDLDGIPSRHQWNQRGSAIKLTMLNADIALVRQIDEGVNIRDDGSVDCTFKGSNQCPIAKEIMPHMIRYSNSRSEFLTDFRDALNLMFQTGYKKTKSCSTSGEVCWLEVA